MKDLPTKAEQQTGGSKCKQEQRPPVSPRIPSAGKTESGKQGHHGSHDENNSKGIYVVPKSAARTSASIVRGPVAQRAEEDTRYGVDPQKPMLRFRSARGLQESQDLAYPITGLSQDGTYEWATDCAKRDRTDDSGEVRRCLRAS